MERKKRVHNKKKIGRQRSSSVENIENWHY